MKFQIFIIVNLIFIQIFFGQNESGKTEIIIDKNGKEHKILNYDNGKEKQSEYLNLLLECKKKADSLLVTHFEPIFFKNKLTVNAENSNWYIKGHRIRIDSLITERPKEIELTYSYVDNNHVFNIIEIGLECKNSIKVTFTNGVPKTSNYKINIDYYNAIKIAKNKGFKEKKTSKSNRFSYLKSLNLALTENDIYQWEIYKIKKKRISERKGSCVFVSLNTKVLFINAENGKHQIKKVKYPIGSMHFF